MRTMESPQLLHVELLRRQILHCQMGSNVIVPHRILVAVLGRRECSMHRLLAETREYGPVVQVSRLEHDLDVFEEKT